MAISQNTYSRLQIKSAVILSAAKDLNLAILLAFSMWLSRAAGCTRDDTTPHIAD